MWPSLNASVFLVISGLFCLSGCGDGKVGPDTTVTIPLPEPDPQPDPEPDPVLPPPGLQPGGGQFRHIDILSFTRALNYNVPAGSARQSAEQWLAQHVDVNEGDLGIKDYDPDVKIFRYEIDLTAITPSSFTLPSSEDAYLHFAEDTQIQYRDLGGNDIGGPITIPGCPDGQAPTPESRIKVHMWESDRFAFNPADPEFRSWQCQRLLERMGTDYDGVFLDEHSPGFKWGLYLRQNRILSGGAVRELAGLRPGGANLSGRNYNELDQQYSALVTDWLGYLRTQLRARNKFILVNPAEYYWVDLAENEYTAAGGVTLEFVHVPFNWSAAGYGAFAERIRRAVDRGVIVDLFGRWCTTGPGNYTAGNYASPADRYRMWRLASYYYVRGLPDSPGIAFFDPSFCNENSSLADYLQEWEPAYEYDIGDPEGEGYVLQQGEAGCSGAYRIYARAYTHGLVLVRPQDDYDCTRFDDSTAAEVVLAGPMKLLRGDATLSEPATTVQIRNAEAVILIQDDGP